MKNKEAIEFNAMDTFKPDGQMPFWNRMVTLIVVEKDGNWHAAKSVGGKKAMIENMEKSDTFLIAWTGKYSSNIFRITHAELKKL